MIGSLSMFMNLTEQSTYLHVSFAFVLKTLQSEGWLGGVIEKSSYFLRFKIF